MFTHGRYLDRWERREGDWRIVHRHYVHTMDEVRTIERTMFDPVATQDRTDPSYAVLGDLL